MPQHFADDWMTYPTNREAFHQIDRFLSTTTIAAGDGPVRELPLASRQMDWTGLRVPAETGTSTFEEFLEESQTDAVLVLHEGEIVFEHHFGGNTPSTRHIAMSVSKSFCGMVAGILVGQDRLDVSSAVTRYIPELAGTAYDGATVRDVLDMTAAPDFDMEYLGEETEVQRGDRCAGWRPKRGDEPGGTREFLTSLRGHGDHGTLFQYCSATTDVLAWIVERAAGAPYAEVLEDLLWRHLGAEADALITVDEDGTPYACAGMVLRLRDLARFGLLIRDRGTRNGEPVIPAAWIDATAAGGEADASESNHVNATYRNQWWIRSQGPAGLFAVGIFGQYLWVDADRDVVVAKFSSNTDPVAALPWQEDAFVAITDFVANRTQSELSH